MQSKSNSLDPNDEGDDPARGRDWPLTLAPRIVRDNFAIDVNTVILFSYISLTHDRPRSTYPDKITS